MSFLSTLLNDVGLGSTTGASQPSGYTFSQQDKDFIKLQFKYGLQLQARLNAGTLPGIDTSGNLIPAGQATAVQQQTYYDSHLWLTTQTLQAPYNGWWAEFKTAIDSEDLNWLSQQVGESVASLTSYMGNLVGSAVGSAISGATKGITTGFFSSLNIYGYIAIAGLGVAVYYGWKHGLIQRAFKTTAKATVI